MSRCDVVPFLVVAVAASAGGLQPILEMVSAIPATAPAALLLAHHRSAAVGSRLQAVLGRSSAMPVELAADGAPLRAGVVLLPPPGSDLELLGPDLRLAVVRQTPLRFVQPSADRLFASVAGVAGHRAVAVVLSGAGTDGAHGVADVKAAGGTVIVQDPATADVRGMPTAAIQTGMADLILPPSRIAETLTRLATLR